ncbi:MULTISPECIES: hypothetical protein [Cryobacterium]|uniref:Glycosyl transferase family 28 C-terminal domain-containing protein n=1 Tax=Cryobacterium breve TaxID=1259258 RepID=A0ABY2J4N0_9MICO|nr:MULTISPECIES: hypothetical protein [Cryobacterium]TFC94101.1 hypothetical protein E3T20_09030 [Cryobacterium sp. TmT3-12]TFC98668.1 hypothetical protein E3O65_07260 [Cryobacterium breve]
MKISGVRLLSKNVKFDFGSGSMIGYYVHHRGSGHLHRAMAVSGALAEPVTILSSLSRPASWTGGWVDLPLDTDVVPVDPGAGGDFHWAPLGSDGLRDRMAAVSTWIRDAKPSVIVVDVSVEVSVLARLHGVRVVTYAQPGDRSDAAHTVGYRVASAIIAPWPAGIKPTVVEPTVEARFHHVGAISRIPVAPDLPRQSNRIAILNGSGGLGVSTLDAFVAQCVEALPDREWVRLEGQSAATVERTLRECSLVLAHCGQNAVAEIAACRTPAILVPEDRPHGEQEALGRALNQSEFPVVVSSPRVGAPRASLIDEALRSGGQAWSEWVDGNASLRAASVIEAVASGAPADRGMPTA